MNQAYLWAEVSTHKVDVKIFQFLGLVLACCPYREQELVEHPVLNC